MHVPGVAPTLRGYSEVRLGGQRRNCRETRHIGHGEAAWDMAKYRRPGFAWRLIQLQTNHKLSTVTRSGSMPLTDVTGHGEVTYTNYRLTGAQRS